MKEKIKQIPEKIINFIKYNRQFTSYVLLALMCTTLTKYLTVGDFFSWQSFFLDIAFIFIFGSFGFLYRPQKQFTYYLVMLFIFGTMGVVNTIYYTFYQSFASFSLLITLGQVGEVGDAVFDKLELFHFIYVIFPISFIYINKYLTNLDYFNLVAKFEKGKRIFIGLLASGAIIIALVSTTLTKTAISRLAKQWNREYIVSTFGIVSYQLNDLFNTLKPRIVSWFGYDVALKQFTDYIEENPSVKSNNKYTDIYKGKNVIFIHLESISTFLIDLEINNEEITPNLNKLTKEGMYFTNFYPQVGVGNSSDTEFTLNTSLMPVTNGTAFVNYFDRNFITIPKLLRDEGYYTFSMHGNKASMWNRNKMHPNLGYMDFYSETSFEIEERIGLGISDESFFRQALTILKEIEDNNDNYMGTMITLSNHTPFENNELFPQIDLTYHGFTEEEIEDTNYLEGTRLGNYLRSSHYADYAIGLFFDYIKESDYFNNTIFVLYGDHDPKLSIKEYNRYYNFDFDTNDILDVEDERYKAFDYYANELNRKTPLIIWSKEDYVKPLKVDYYMGMIDVMPTIGNMLGIHNKFAFGHDIFEIKDDNIIAFPNGNFLTNKVYYNNSKEEYRAISLEESLSEEYINYCKEYTENLIELSNGIIFHNLIDIQLKKEAEE